MYDSRDLTTHAVCVGMTGSGKTGLGISLLEEAAHRQGMPVIAIDPQGRPGQPAAHLSRSLSGRRISSPGWTRPVGRGGKGTVGRAAFAAEARPRPGSKGLADSGRGSASASARLKASRPILRSTRRAARRGCRSPMLRVVHARRRTPCSADADLYARSTSRAWSPACSTLVGIDADPVDSRRAHPAVVGRSTATWQQGRHSLDLAGLIGAIQNPPHRQNRRVLDLESFYPVEGPLRARHGASTTCSRRPASRPVTRGRAAGHAGALLFTRRRASPRVSRHVHRAPGRRGAHVLRHAPR